VTTDQRFVESPPLQGIVAACLTPFTADGEVDLPAMERQIEFVVGDADAIAIAAVEASEHSMLDARERRLVLREGARMVAGRKPLILGASSPRVATVAELAELAVTEGADYIQVLAPRRPWGGEPEPSELLGYFQAVQSVSPLPIVAYHNPSCGADPSVETWGRLSELPAIQGIKESSRDISKIGRMIETVQATGNVAYLTTMQPLLTTLALGGAGGAMPPPGTRIGALVKNAIEAGDLDTARDWQRVFNTFPALWSAYGLPPVMKSAMRHFGVDLGEPRKPYLSVTDQDHIRIGEFLRSAGVIDSGEHHPEHQ